MNFHKIFKPTTLKLSLTVMLFVLSYTLSGLINIYPDSQMYGFPLMVQELYGPCNEGERCVHYDMLNLILDMLFWYIVSAIIMTFIREKNLK